MKSTKINFRALADSVYPRQCPVCGEIVTPRGQLICRKCLDRLSFVKAPVCEKCGKQILTASQRLCGDCTRKPKSFVKGCSLLNYDELSRDLMVQMKYHNSRQDIELYARLGAMRIRQELHGGQCGSGTIAFAPTKFDYLVPVPVHKSKYRERGYNQAEILAQLISKELNIPVGKDFLIRIKKTEAQKNLDPNLRERNLKDAFRAGLIPQDVVRVLLVDDIYTTGSTAEVCSEVLMEAGVREVYVFCICSGSEI